MMRRGRRMENAEGKISVALAGNPNVGKSTLFNSLTGMHAHTGNWAGKTVGCESAPSRFGEREIRIFDIPGTYSLYAHSEEERIARDFICFGGADVTVVVCDATSIMQNLNLLLQISECGARVILALNFLSAAEREGIFIDTKRLSEELSVPVVAINASKRRDMYPLVREICRTADSRISYGIAPILCDSAERAISLTVERLSHIDALSSIKNNERRLRFIALSLLEADELFGDEVLSELTDDERERRRIINAAEEGRRLLFSQGINAEAFGEMRVSATVLLAEQIAERVVTHYEPKRTLTSRLDGFFTGRITAYPAMLSLLILTLFITLFLANYPSALLLRFFELCEGWLDSALRYLGASEFLRGALVCGMVRILGRVVSVMAPPMIIFFPLFSILEDSGYLPRIAYNLDRPFASSGACGKQALTMCMGLGCNAVGVTGCRIIDSERERKLAIVTNSLVPCNGRLPMLITLISVFFIFISGEYSSVSVALMLCAFVVLAIAMTFLSTYVLSKTLFRGECSSFTIEMPPYRRPRILNTIYRSLVDKCASVLLRAVIVSLPLGLLVWLLENLKIGGVGVLSYIASILDPIGIAFGMDGVILLSFIIGIPANEIVVPLMLMLYSSGGAIGGEASAFAVGEVFLNAGWTPVTAIAAAIFALFHFPCSTSLITIYKETRSKFITAISFILPTAIGLSLAFSISLISRLFM